MRGTRPALKTTLALALLGAGADAEPVDPAFLDDLPSADVFLLGEVHDNPIHHRNQARAIAALRPNAVVFEMLDPEAATVANSTDVRGAKLGQKLAWDESGWPDWSLYQPVFEALGEASVVGMALPRADVRRSVMEGAASIFGEGADVFGLEDPLSQDEQERHEALQFAAHCDALPAEMLPGMVEAQRLRDAGFAKSILQALEEHGPPVAVVVGTGHLGEDWGIPSVLARVAPEVSVRAIAQVEGAPSEPERFSQWIETEAAEREDPCEGFAKAHGASDG